MVMYFIDFAYDEMGTWSLGGRLCGQGGVFRPIGVYGYGFLGVLVPADSGLQESGELGDTITGHSSSGQPW